MKVRDIGFRSVVQTTIMTERPATLSTILMERPLGNCAMFMQFFKPTRGVSRCGSAAIRVKTRAEATEY